MKREKSWLPVSAFFALMLLSVSASLTFTDVFVAAPFALSAIVFGFMTVVFLLLPFAENSNRHVDME